MDLIEKSCEGVKWIELFNKQNANTYYYVC